MRPNWKACRSGWWDGAFPWPWPPSWKQTVSAWAGMSRAGEIGWRITGKGGVLIEQRFGGFGLPADARDDCERFCEQAHARAQTEQRRQVILGERGGADASA